MAFAAISEPVWAFRLIGEYIGREIISGRMGQFLKGEFQHKEQRERMENLVLKAAQKLAQSQDKSRGLLNFKAKVSLATLTTLARTLLDKNVDAPVSIHLKDMEQTFPKGEPIEHCNMQFKRVEDQVDIHMSLDEPMTKEDDE